MSDGTFNPPGYPPVSFSFQLSFSGSNGTSEAAFQEASGISMETNVEEVSSGGDNRFKYRLPGVNKYSNLVLKRGLVPKDSPLFNWCDETLNQGMAQPIKPQKISVALLDVEKKVLISWDFIDAYPVKWSVAEFKSMENAYVVESVEFAYTYFTAVKK
ncbi:MAG: phage tail protein [Saprospiraceae bacterium]|nr:phage tail protein [Lewinella sp.]